MSTFFNRFWTLSLKAIRSAKVWRVQKNDNFGTSNAEAHPPLYVETVLETQILLAPVSLEADRGDESIEELRAILRRTTFVTEARLAAIVDHYMTKYSQNEADAIRMILLERDQGR